MRYTYARKSASQAVLRVMLLTLPATSRIPRLMPAKSSWSAKTRRSPSRHCKDARVYGHNVATTAIHANDNTPLRPPCRLPRPCDLLVSRCSSNTVLVTTFNRYKLSLGCSLAPSRTFSPSRTVFSRPDIAKSISNLSRLALAVLISRRAKL